MWFAWTAFVTVRLGYRGATRSSQESFGAAVRIDVNRASVDVLALLPSIGRVRAESVVLHRVRHGWFRRLEDLALIDGIGSETLASLRPFVCFCPCGTRPDAPIDCSAHGVGSHSRR